MENRNFGETLSIKDSINMVILRAVEESLYRSFVPEFVRTKFIFGFVDRAEYAERT